MQLLSVIGHFDRLGPSAAFRAEKTGQRGAAAAALFVVSRIAVAFCRSFSRDLCCILHMINHYAALITNTALYGRLTICEAVKLWPFFKKTRFTQGYTLRGSSTIKPLGQFG
jgi:hypothetical protein